MIRCLKQCSCLVLVLAFLSLSAANAQDKAALSDDQIKERLSFIENALDSGQTCAKVWFYGWIAAYSTGAAVQWGLSIAHWNDVKPADDSPNAPAVRDRALAQDMLVGGTTTALESAAYCSTLSCRLMAPTSCGPYRKTRRKSGRRSFSGPRNSSANASRGRKTGGAG